MTTINAIRAHSGDNCVTLIAACAAGQTVSYTDDGQISRLTAREAIPQYHKLAIADIPRAAPVRKYGSAIGLAAVDISAGRHIHTHNLEPLPRGKEE
ncbi:MAG: UxaA family hydrolase [Bacillota bacterium]|nr:UxaA family hydrolase [Bacillota bacterium]